ncbi:MarR family winged helix-turn-helix transcriptional regulator [Nakamurella lactea]|uniref:MarR family winged helix-turn-helix transcriptional regulator n=1 Tax=Nakamurella lactea TaxID=459515 RepID=UPI000410B3FF|nr:MarR family transcriptional regulator [Nakamurella lactea]
MDDPNDGATDGPLLGRRLSAAVVMFHQALADRMGLSAADHKALDIIDRSGPLTAGALAEQTGLTRSAITALVDRLVRVGYASRDPDPDDRRRVLITAVIDHPPAVRRAFADLATAMEEILAGYNRSEQAAIRGYLAATIEVLEEAARRLG